MRSPRNMIAADSPLVSLARSKHSIQGGAKRHGYHKDLIPDGAASGLATCLLDACQSAWVFGGMGSWNDMSFEGVDPTEYDRVSEQLFSTLNETIQTAANVSCALNP